ncbi:MAG: 16S rRNA (cytidine(1402)-2'-O)-methyltransferase [Vicinamibacterales bacterium]|nr:16S rRNA (cytidine(1402)-2'-O)-methyltransferase [Vicinamibacterales bacterium]
MPGTLFVVATPIGNLEDITLRAVRVLREVAVVAAEDTRRTGNLLRHLGIDTRLLSLHEHNEHERIPPLLARLAAGESVAVVSDAGTPGVSDPGMRLAEAAVAAGIRVEPVPGASAVLAALAGSGVAWNSFAFLGFPPLKAKDRKTWVSGLAASLQTSVFFEAPHRVRRTLGELAAILGERQIVVARELTKVHEEFIRGTASEILARLESPKGEFTVVVPPASGAEEVQRSPLSDEDITVLFGQMTENGAVSRKAALREVAEATGRPVNEVYDAIERHKQSVKQQNS